MDTVASLHTAVPKLAVDTPFKLAYLIFDDYPELVQILQEPDLWQVGFGNGPGSQPTDEAGYLHFIRTELDIPARVLYTLRGMDGTLLGIISYFLIEPTKLRVEVGQPVLARGYWGLGYIHMALMALTRHAILCGYHRVQVETDVLNRRLTGVYEDAGFVLEGTRRHSSLHADGSRRDIQTYSITLDEWQDPTWQARYMAVQA